ncbi:MAG: TraK family protein [Acidobacteriota bacterium]|nr:TraK family protein [Acidobacteriota bacterium]
MDHTSKNNLDLTRLRARMAEKPRTKFGQVRQAWPHIKALFDAGHSLKDIWIWLNEIGIEIGYARLSDYTGQLKRRGQATAHPVVAPVIQQTGTTPECPPSLPNDAGARQIKTALRLRRRRMIRSPISGIVKIGARG